MYIKLVREAHICISTTLLSLIFGIKIIPMTKVLLALWRLLHSNQCSVFLYIRRSFYSSTILPAMWLFPTKIYQNNWRSCIFQFLKGLPCYMNLQNALNTQDYCWRRLNEYFSTIHLYSVTPLNKIHWPVEFTSLIEDFNTVTLSSSCPGV